MIRRCKNFHQCDAADSTNSTCIKSACRELGGEMIIYELGLLQYINIVLVPTAIYTILKYHKYRRNVCEKCCIDPSREANKSLMQNVAYLKKAMTYNNELYVSELHRIDDEHDKFHEGLIKENERLRNRLKCQHILLIPKRCMEEINDRTE